MKLSEAIRLGAMLGPQAFAESFSVDGGSCARGAAMLAIGGTCWYSGPWFIEFQSINTTCPECHRIGTAGGIIAFCLNDHHRWTRERIADWVETVETAQEAKVAELVEAS